MHHRIKSKWIHKCKFSFSASCYSSNKNKIRITFVLLILFWNQAWHWRLFAPSLCVSGEALVSNEVKINREQIWTFRIAPIFPTMQKTKIKRQNTKIPKLKYKINIITYLFCSIISVKYFAIVATSLATASDIHQGYMLF